MQIFSSVLVLTNDETSEVVEALFDLGYVPLIRTKMTTALKDIRHKCVTVIFLDLRCVEIDALEFVINVRDIDQYLPVVIVNGSMEGEKQIFDQQNIFFISKTFSSMEKSLTRIVPDEGGR